MFNPIPAFSFKCITFRSFILKFEKVCFGNNQTSFQSCADTISVAQIFFRNLLFLPLFMLSMFLKTAKNSVLMGVSELSITTFWLRLMSFLIDRDSLRIKFYLHMLSYDLLMMQTHFSCIVKLCS